MAKFKLEDHLDRQFQGEKRRGLLPGQAPPCSADGCIPKPEGRTYQIQHLWQRHHRMKQLHLMGMSNRDIAAELGVTEVTVGNVLNSELMRREIEIASGSLDKEAVDVAARLQKLCEAAAAQLEQTLAAEGTPAGLKTKISLEVLKGRGFLTTNIKGTLDVNHFTGDEIEKIKENARQAALRDGNLVVDVTPQELN